MSFNVCTSEVAATGFVMMVVAFFIAEMVGAIVTSIRQGTVGVGRKRVGLGGMLVFFSWMFVFVASLVVSDMGYGLLPDWFYFIGMTVMAIGIALRQWAIAVLGRYFSRTFGVEPEQKVIEAGPYHYIRHPSYTGILLFCVGMGLAVASWVAVLIGVAVFAVAFGYWISLEEKVLVHEFGSTYVDYMKRTKRLIPKIV
jgi:protein-S-isoprenylcysteine O-methyltransferase Ste14